NHGAIKATKLLDEPESLISTILIGNNLVNNLAAATATILAIRLYGDSAVVPASILLTLVFLIFAEIIPKTVAAYHSEGVAFKVSYVLLPLKKVLFPVIWVVNRIIHFFLRFTGFEANNNTENLSMDELRTIVGEAGHMIPKRHQGMLMNILDLEQVTVDDIMIPRNEVYGIDLDNDVQTILRRLQQSEFTRMPVYREDINNIVGILHQRDVISSIDERGQVKLDLLMKTVKDPYFVPESTPLHTQLFNFQKQKHRQGVVVDEYGVVQGIVTLEDLLEEIVGEFTSNLIEDNNQDIIPQKDGSHILDGTATIRDINRATSWELPTDGPKTLNGLLLEHLESFPDGLACVRLGKYFFEITETKDNLIKSVRATSLKKPKKKKKD
ncbi:MAG: Mg2+/Co2+ transporter CorB, partial [Paracoccaceae bacterium]